MERVAATSGSAPDAPDHEHAFDASPVSLRKDESTSSGRGSVTQGGSKRSKKLAELLALQYPSRCHALPAGDAAVEKVLYFVRHGEATHNVVRETHVGTDNPYLNPALTDAPLTAVGRAQAERLRPAADGLPLELVISSPLTRALETARLAFAAHLARGAPFVAVESCREQIGQNLCDKRQPASLTRPLFPEADMSAIAEADELFTPARETLGALAQRADAFLHEIRRRPEKHIAVVSHSSFFLALFNATLDTARAPELREWFDNGAMRVAHVAYD